MPNNIMPETAEGLKIWTISGNQIMINKIKGDSNDTI